MSCCEKGKAECKKISLSIIARTIKTPTNNEVIYPFIEGLEDKNLQSLINEAIRSLIMPLIQSQPNVQLNLVALLGELLMRLKELNILNIKHFSFSSDGSLLKSISFELCPHDFSILRELFEPTGTHLAQLTQIIESLLLGNLEDGFFPPGDLNMLSQLISDL